MLQANVILPYAGTLAEVAALDRFVLCDGNNGTPDLRDKFVRSLNNLTGTPGVSGGAATHTHTSTAHVHLVNHHTHTYTTDNTCANPDGRRSGDKCPRDCHNHSGTTSTTSGQTNDTGVFTYGVYSNNPPYYELLYIMSTDLAEMPAKAIVMRDDATVRTGLTFCNGDSSTPDLRDRYVRGAGAGDEIGATGGSYTHEHSLAHTHTGSHSHTGSISQTVGNRIGTDGDQNQSSSSHSHAVSLTARTDNLASSTTTAAQLNGDGSNIEPAYRHLSYSMNTSGNPMGASKGDIFVWANSVASIPVGFTICDGRDGTPNMLGRFAKQPTVVGVHTTGGADTHTHPAISHSHSVSNTSHSHSGSAAGTPNNTTCSVHNDGYGLYNGHGHGINSSNVQTVNVTYANAETSALSSDNIPQNVSVVFIRFEFAPSPSAFIMN